MISASSKRYALPSVVNDRVCLYDMWKHEMLYVSAAKYTILDGKGNAKRITVVIQKQDDGKYGWDFAPRTQRVVSKPKLKAVEFQLNRDLGYGKGFSWKAVYFDSDDDAGYKTANPDDIVAQFKTEKEWSSFVS